MEQTILTLKCPEYYDLYMTCHVHGWKNLAPFEWDYEKIALRFAAFVGKQPVDILVRQIADTVKVTLTSDKRLNKVVKSDVVSIVSRSLGLGTDVSGLLKTAQKIGPEYLVLIKKGAARLLRAPTLWEDAAKTLFTTNCTWSLTQQMCAAACSKRFSRAAPSGSYPFPPPHIIAEYTPKQIQKQMPVGYRSEYLIALAKRFSKDSTLSGIETNGFSYKEADKLVRSLKGFGDYAVAHLLILCGYFNEIPVDTVVVSYLKKNYRIRKPTSFIDRKYEKWRAYKWWGLKLEKMMRNQNWLGDGRQSA